MAALTASVSRLGRDERSIRSRPILNAAGEARRHLSAPLLGRASQEDTSVRRTVMFGLLALAVPVLAAGQTKDDFEYWDLNGNGDLTVF